MADHSNNRVLLYGNIPQSSGVPAAVVIGQINMTTGLENKGEGIGYDTLANPQDVKIDGGKLFVADMKNNRVLIFNSVPSTNNQRADVVIGQTDGTSGARNQGLGVGANTLNYPHGIAIHQQKLIIADTLNNRVLIYNSIPNTHNASADVVVGQSSFLEKSAACTANRLAGPQSVAVENGRLYIADNVNNRVLIYNNIPTINGASADRVIGQEDFHSNISGLSQFRLNGPANISVDSGRIAITDGLNNRILLYNSVPVLNFAAADIVLGQSDFSTANLGLTNNRFGNNPRSAYVFEDRIIVTDTANHRVLLFQDAFNITGHQPNTGVVGEQIKLSISGIQIPDAVRLDLYAGTQYAGISNIVKITDQLLQCQVGLSGLTPGYFTLKVTGTGIDRELNHSFHVLEPSIPPLEWQIAAIASLGPSALAGSEAGIVVADADNDQENEVIIANRNLYLTKMDYLASGWQSSALPSAGAGENYITTIAADSDHDGQIEVLGGAINDQLYVLENITWDRTTAGVLSHDVTALAYGDGNNESYNQTLKPK